MTIKMVTNVDIEEFEIKNPKVYLGFVLGGCLFVIYKMIVPN
jgi:hypothetical protein